MVTLYQFYQMIVLSAYQLFDVMYSLELHVATIFVYLHSFRLQRQII